MYKEVELMKNDQIYLPIAISLLKQIDTIA